MRRKSLSRSLSFALIIIVLAVVNSAAQDPAAAPVFKLNRTVVPGLTNTDGLRELIVTSPKLAIGFFTDNLLSPITSRLHRVWIDSKGKIGNRIQLTDVPGGRLYGCKALWFTAEKRGLLAYGFANAVGEFWLTTQPFDENGNPVSTETRHFGIKAPSGQGIQYITIAACTAGDKVLLCATMAIAQIDPAYTGTTESRLYMVVVDHDGLPVGPAKRVSLPSNGIMKSVTISAKPLEYGATILLPLESTRYVVGDTSGGTTYGRTTGTDIYLTSVQVSDGQVSLKHRLIAVNNVANAGTVSQAVGFMTPPELSTAGAALPRSVGMLYVSGKPDPDPINNLQSFDFYYYLQPVNRKGKKAGAAIPVKTPKWQHLLTPDPARSPIAADTLSEPLYHDGNKWLVIQSLSLYRNKYSPSLSRDYEYAMRLLAIDGASGEVTRITEKVGTPALLFFEQPYLMRMGANYLAESDGYMFDDPLGSVPYFSPFRVKSVKP